MSIWRPEMVGFCLTMQTKRTRPTYLRHCIHKGRTEISVAGSHFVLPLEFTYCTTFRLLTVLCGRTSLFTIATGLISFLSGSPSISSGNLNSVSLVYATHGRSIRFTYRRSALTPCYAIDTFSTIVLCMRPISCLYI